jgi:hypothetical protein
MSSIFTQFTVVSSKVKFYLIALILPFLILSCAQIVTPTGGPRDTTPPKITKTVPNNNSVNFSSNYEIRINFDEFVDLVSPNDKVLISPPLKETPIFKVSGKSLSIKFSDTLMPNTTYTFFFDNCIRDITEGNLIPSMEYVFSTGNDIDSGSIKGSVVDALTLKPEKQVYVFLYNQNIDTLPQTTKPLYLTKTDDQGAFVFGHIIRGSYKTFALSDKNNNLIFDQFSERIGYLPNLVLSDSSTSQQIFLFTQADTVQKVFKKSIMERGKALITFKKNAKETTFKLRDGDFENRFIKEISTNGDSVFLYDKLFIPDTVSLIITDKNMADTLEIAPSIERKSSRRIGETKTKITAIFSNSRDLYKPIVISFDSPIKSLDQNKVKLYKITSNDTSKVVFNLISADVNFKNYKLNFKKEEQNSYLVVISDSAAFGYNKLTNDTIKQTFTTYTENDYGNLIIHLENKKNQSVIIQLLNESFEVVEEQFTNTDKDIKWVNLLPGTFQIRAIIDQNNNRKWDTGDYFNHVLPEKIIYFATPIIIRAKWDIEEKLIVD